MLVPQTPAAAALPDTPQGKRVAAYVAAFNLGEGAFVKAHDEHFSKALLDRITVARRREMFTRMKGDFGTLAVGKVIKATDRQIVFQLAEHEDATFTFEFEEAAPHRITMVNIEVGG
jgi:hypothetical protein